MEHFFLSIYHYFKTRRFFFWLAFISAWVLVALGASRINIEEDITQFFPDDQRVEKLNYVFKNSKFSDRLVMMVSVRDSATTPEPDSLVAFTEELAKTIESALRPYLASMETQVDDSKITDLFDAVRENLPIFLEDEDYILLDSLVQPEVMRQTLSNHYQQLVSPTGMITKKVIVEDPLGFSFLALRKLQQLQYDKNFELYDSYILTRDRRHMLFFIRPLYAANETKENKPLIDGLDKITQNLSAKHPGMLATYFGATAVAEGNARQIRNDTMLTVSLMIILLTVFLIGFFRKKRIPFLILVPVGFGGLFALSCIYFIKGSVSILAIAAGSIILGIAVNYALHFLVHLKHTGSVEHVIKDLVKPMTIGSATTVLAFFCLQFVNAAVLRDVGLFAGFSLVGAALCSLIFLPHLVSDELFKSTQAYTFETKFELTPRWNKIIVIVILLLTPIFLYFAGSVNFNTDISKLNYMEDRVAEAQRRLETINQTSLSSVFVVSQRNNLEEALQSNERAQPELNRLLAEGTINKYASVSSFMISDSLQRLRINRWNEFWKEHNVHAMFRTVRQAGAELKFSEIVFQNFEQLLSKQYQPVDPSITSAFRRAFFDDYIIEKHGLATVVTLVNVDPSKKDAVYQSLAKASLQAFDRQTMTNLFVEYVHSDFNFIVAFTSMLVFLALLLSYGRVELTLITFLPMLVTWVWILGIMALVGIEFNIVNVTISTFIFGLGDDYSIFTMDGLLQEYKYGRKNLPSIRISIFLSALTTISGLGVLIFAGHPALKSIAAISIIGIVCVFLMSQTLSPFLFRWIVLRRTERGLPPMTLLGMGKTIFTYGFFVTGSFLLTIIGLLFKLVPVKKRKVRLFYHSLLSFFTRSLINLAANLKKKVINQTPQTFSRATIIVSNHSSFLDILLTTMLHPKLILLTNKWVWNSPVFGGVVRLADYYPVMDGAEDSTDRLRSRIEEGYSIVVFPEGTRSADGKIGRFHKGAFYMAETLQLPIQPLLIHGAAMAIPKNTIYLSDSFITLKFLPPIEPADKRFGETYSERTKSISKFFKDEFARLAAEIETPAFFAKRLISNYLYKGPVLEWYMRIKLRLENNYEPFHGLVPRHATVLDLGCGYGFLCYMLHFLSGERTITGVDYDEDKIAAANHCFSKTDRINFIAADISKYALGKYDVIIIADVLHYLEPALQDDMINRCLRALNPGGRLVIREGNTELKDRHQGTKVTEFFSVKLLKFNKSVNELHFISGEHITALARVSGFEVNILDDTKLTSNVIFVVEKKPVNI
ncbi:MAG: 1-acyl-sn-glycerol-3-phosphate acyltransferase [Bacteroidota bacterium]